MLTHNAVWFASARDFNDPYDCTIPTAPGPITDEKAEERMRYLLSKENPRISEGDLKGQIAYWMKRKPWQDPENLERTSQLDQERKFAQGILTMSACRDDILMWSHYANAHGGFCVGFDTASLDAYFKRLYNNDGLIIDLRKVDYVEECPHFEFYEMDEQDWFVRPLITKFRVWEYEQEYRFLLIDKTNIQFALDNGIIVEVILGRQMPSEHKEEIKEVLREKGSKVELFEARMKEKSFGLDFISVDY